MTEVRFRAPGLGTLTVHFLMVVVLLLALLPLVILRAAFVPAAELLIRATDDLHDALSARLDL